MLEDTPQEIEDAKRRATKRRVLRLVLTQQGYTSLASNVNILTERQLDEMLNLTGGNNYHEYWTENKDNDCE